MLPAIGYPPPWPLLLGGIYRPTYALVPDLALYNAAIKLPVIAANAALAYLAGAALHNLGAAPAIVRRAWLALLFNPFVLFVGAAWGQIDAVVALLALAALLLVGRPGGATSPPSCWRWPSASSRRRRRCCSPCCSSSAPPRSRTPCGTPPSSPAGAFVFYVLPFLALGWDASPARVANAQLSMAGAMSLSTIAQLWRDPLVLEGHWWLLGLLWAPALLVAVVAVALAAARTPPTCSPSAPA